MPDSDPRLGLPSASGFEADVMCHGRQNLIKSLPPEALKETYDADAEFGDAIHKARQTGDTSKLNDDQRLIYENGLENEEKIVNQWASEFHLKHFKEGPREVRLYYNDPYTMEPLTSAQLDVHYVALPHVLIVDWKTLWCTRLTRAEANWQGRIQVVCAAREYAATHIRMSFNKAMFKREDSVDYAESDIERAEESLRYQLWEIGSAEAVRRAGPHCHYCPAQAHCPEAGAWSLLPMALNRQVPVGSDDIEAIVRPLTLEQCKRVWEVTGTIEKILERIKERLKHCSDEQLAQIGLALSAGKQLDPITDVRGAFDTLIEAGLSADAVWQAMEMSKTKIRQAVQTEFVKSGEKAKEWVDKTLKKHITPVTSKSSLKKAKF